MRAIVGTLNACNVGTLSSTNDERMAQAERNETLIFNLMKKTKLNIFLHTFQFLTSSFRAYNTKSLFTIQSPIQTLKYLPTTSKSKVSNPLKINNNLIIIK